MREAENTRTLTIIRDEKKKPKAIIVNEVYEIRKDGKVYDIHYANMPIKDYPKWLDEPNMKKLIKSLWNN